MKSFYQIILVIFILTKSFFSLADHDFNSRRVLGETRLSNNWFSDSDHLYVSGHCPSENNRPVQTIMLQVLQRDAEIDLFAIRYGNGRWEEINVREIFNAGSTSRMIDLPGGERCIEEIFIRGRTLGFGHRESLVRVIAFSDNNSYGRPFQLGSALLNQRIEGEIIHAYEQRARALQLVIEHEDAEIDFLGVEFGNGEFQKLDVREYFRAGSRSRVIDLNGDRRRIVKIVVVGKSLDHRRPALVRILGYN